MGHSRRAEEPQKDVHAHFLMLITSTGEELRLSKENQHLKINISLLVSFSSMMFSLEVSEVQEVQKPASSH